MIPRLTSDTPVKSLEVAQQLLQDNKIPFDKKRMKGYTLKSIVGEILKMLGCKAWYIKRNEHLAIEISEQVKKCLVDALKERDRETKRAPLLLSILLLLLVAFSL